MSVVNLKIKGMITLCVRALGAGYDKLKVVLADLIPLTCIGNICLYATSAAKLIKIISP